MKEKKKAYRPVRYNEIERLEVFVERKLVMPTVHKNKKKFNKKKERQIQPSMDENSALLFLIQLNVMSILDDFIGKSISNGVLRFEPAVMISVLLYFLKGLSGV